MNRSDGSLNVGLRAVFAQQALIATVAVTGFAWFQQLPAALSSAFGAAVAVAMSVLLAFKIKRLDRRLQQNKAVGVGTVMIGLAPRLLLVLAAFWLGISILGLDPLPMTVAFALVHLGYLFNCMKFR